MSERMRYVLALVVGLLAIPSLALAANTALTDDAARADWTAVEAGPTSPGVSAADLVRACGAEGRYLIDLEAAGMITDVEQAALNALRPICEDASLPLPPPPLVSSDVIVETITVGPPVTAPTAGTSTTTVSSTGVAATEAVDARLALHARATALAAIEMAIEVGGEGDDINEAIGYLEAGDAAYTAGDYHEAVDRYQEAEEEAMEARHDRHDDHNDHDDHDEYEDDHDDDDHDHDHEDDD